MALRPRRRSREHHPARSSTRVPPSSDGRRRAVRDRCRTARISDELSRRLHEAGIVFRGSSTAEFVHGAQAAPQRRPGAARPRRRAGAARRTADRGPAVGRAGLHPRHRARRGARSRPRLRRPRRDGVSDQARRGRGAAGRRRRRGDRRAGGSHGRPAAAATGDPRRPPHGARHALPRGHPDRGRGFDSTVSDVGPWDPPTKIAAHHPGPYLGTCGRARWTRGCCCTCSRRASSPTSSPPGSTIARACWA